MVLAIDKFEEINHDKVTTVNFRLLESAWKFLEFILTKSWS